ncbi:protein kinase family protein [Phycisphaera mikurensis]|uniref:Protein kinase domain-containing protein n=1 Tax=Phycisphaera mikurensis (strain NBRC 102666 / KCTC 22515 / FYK2301M01) TaxID=1142394 RepID=I0IDB9_PHYMF|nr:hypothetical protein [Phycisphaera mikurensis]MBB6442381.1 hypothetical protein [Phycisphaera mikurensis]BAM03257.1 hypothetical protein PSMK_10980 [Phycisphaera mikurensis NBRC 102666]
MSGRPETPADGQRRGDPGGVAGTGTPRARDAVAAAVATRLNGKPTRGPGQAGPERVARLHRLPAAAAAAPPAPTDPEAPEPAVNLYVAAAPAAVPADALLARLRWGGVLLLTAANRRALAAREAGFAGGEWLAEGDPCPLPPWPLAPSGLLGPVLGWPGRRAAARAWRKVRHEPEDRPSLYHHSFDVRLGRDAGQPSGFRVIKRVPTMTAIQRRLARHAERGGGAKHADLEQAARKLGNKIFPVFLTREAAFLKILQERLPELVDAGRFPRVLDLEKDERGFVKRIEMSWLRLGGPPIGAVAFATGAVELVEKLHRVARIVHLDLRLDNFVITDSGVCLVDFGSGIRVGETFDSRGMLDKLLQEMLSSSRIRQDLRRMQRKDRVTSPVFENAYDPPGPAVDLYSVAQNLTQAARHAEFSGLLRSSKREASELSRLRRGVLRPAPGEPVIATTAELLEALRTLGRRLARGRGR